MAAGNAGDLYGNEQDAAQQLDTLAAAVGSFSNPAIFELNTQSAVRNSAAYVTSTGVMTSADATPYQALSIFNPVASGKTLLIQRVWAELSGGANAHPDFLLYKQTTDPSGSWTTPVAVTPVNCDFGSGNTSVATVKRTNTANGNHASLAGTLLSGVDSANNVEQDLLALGMSFKVPATYGLTVYVNSTSTTIMSLNAFWYEY